jgi:hypothetical protein
MNAAPGQSKQKRLCSGRNIYLFNVFDAYVRLNILTYFRHKGCSLFFVLYPNVQLHTYRSGPLTVSTAKSVPAEAVVYGARPWF